MSCNKSVHKRWTFERYAATHLQMSVVAQQEEHEQDNDNGSVLLSPVVSAHEASPSIIQSDGDDLIRDTNLNGDFSALDLNVDAQNNHNANNNNNDVKVADEQNEDENMIQKRRHKNKNRKNKNNQNDKPQPLHRQIEESEEEKEPLMDYDDFCEAVVAEITGANDPESLSSWYHSQLVLIKSLAAKNKLKALTAADIPDLVQISPLVSEAMKHIQEIWYFFIFFVHFGCFIYCLVILSFSFSQQKLTFCCFFKIFVSGSFLLIIFFQFFHQKVSFF